MKVEGIADPDKFREWFDGNLRGGVAFEDKFPTIIDRHDETTSRGFRDIARVALTLRMCGHRDVANWFIREFTEKVAWLCVGRNADGPSFPVRHLHRGEVMLPLSWLLIRPEHDNPFNFGFSKWVLRTPEEAEQNKLAALDSEDPYVRRRGISMAAEDYPRILRWFYKDQAVLQFDYNGGLIWNGPSLTTDRFPTQLKDIWADGGHLWSSHA